MKSLEAPVEETEETQRPEPEPEPVSWLRRLGQLLWPKWLRRRPIRYAYFVSYSWISSRGLQGTGCLEITNDLPVRRYEDLRPFMQLISEELSARFPLQSNTPVITFFKLTAKLVLRKGEWVLARRQPKP